jgi:hypothetical protein
LPVVQPTKFELAINLNLQRRSASNARATKPHNATAGLAFFPPHPKRIGFIRSADSIT